MDGLFLKFNPGKAAFSITHNDGLLFLGSCFSDEIAARAKDSGFHCASNPFGTVFHPLPLARFLKETISGRAEERIFNREDHFFSWDASTLLSGKSQDEVYSKLQKVRSEWYHQLKTASLLFVTFGTAWGYSYHGSPLVANCHRVPQAEFRKELSETIDILQAWNDVLEIVLEFNPSLKIVFTVSPVRHIRDGLIENNQSKAILLDAVRRLNKENGSFYFPSYEIVIDQLRDYRFFKQDRIHPTDEAVAVVWDSFLNYYVNDATRLIVNEINAYHRFKAHVPRNADEKGLVDHTERCERMRSELKTKYPDIPI